MKHIEKDKNGKLYADYTSWEYFNKIDALSNSTLKEFIKGPEYVGLKKESKIEYLIGHAVEDLLYQAVFNDGRFDKKFFIDSSGNSRPSNWEEVIFSKDKDQFLKKNKDGKISKHSTNDWILMSKEKGAAIPLKQEEFENIKGMTESLLKLEIKFIHDGKQFGGINYGDLIGKSIVEQPIVWEDEDGLLKKCMPDLIVDPGIGGLFLSDLKTYRDNPKTFNKQANNLRYDIQAVHYKEGVKAKYGGEVTKMHFIVVEKNFPHVCGISTFKDDENYEKCEFNYEISCKEYKDWATNNKPLKGHLDEIQELRIYNNILE